MQNYVKISENSVKNLEILLNISRVFCKLVDLGSVMVCAHKVTQVGSEHHSELCKNFRELLEKFRDTAKYFKVFLQTCRFRFSDAASFAIANKTHGAQQQLPPCHQLAVRCQNAVE